MLLASSSDSSSCRQCSLAFEYQLCHLLVVVLAVGHSLVLKRLVLPHASNNTSVVWYKY